MCSYIWYELSSLPTNFKAADIPLTDQPTKHTSYVSILLFLPTNMWEKANCLEVHKSLDGWRGIIFIAEVSQSSQL